MTESTGVKGEMHCHSGFLAIFGTIKQQGVRSVRGILLSPQDPYQGPALDPLGCVWSLRILPSATWELPSSAKGVTSETQGVTWYLDQFYGSYCYRLTPCHGPLM